MLNLLTCITLGAGAGCLAGLLMRGGWLGVFGNMGLGILGAVIGGFVPMIMWPGQFSFTGLDIGSLLTALIGAALLILMGRLFRIEHAPA
jgi:uncharacterized membrane protein YeaQ/YmgE (transglycosylase-associated protein family)